MKIVKNWRKVLKTYSFLSIVANLLVAISATGLSVLGVLSTNMAFSAVATGCIAFGVIGVVGRFLDQAYDDMREEENGDNS